MSIKCKVPSPTLLAGFVFMVSTLPIWYCSIPSVSSFVLMSDHRRLGYRNRCSINRRTTPGSSQSVLFQSSASSPLGDGSFVATTQPSDDASILEAFTSAPALGTVHPKVTTQQRVTAEGVVTIVGVGEFLDFVNSDRDYVKDQQQLCVIKYHAHWCRICHRVGVKYRKIAKDFNQNVEDQQYIGQRVRFGDVEVSANTELCQTLGIRKFPFVEIYEGGTKIAAFSTGPSYKFNLVRDTIRDKLAMSRQEKEEFLLKFKDNIDEGRQLMQTLENEYLAVSKP